MSADRVPDGFQLVTKGKGQRTTEPQLAVYGNGQGYLNAVAVDVLGDHPAVRAFVEPETYRVALVGTDGEGKHDYALDCETETSGGDFRFQSALKRLDIDTDDIEETYQIPLTNEDGVLVGDVSAVAGAKGPAVEGSDNQSGTTAGERFTKVPCGCGGYAIYTDEQPEAVDVVCPVCGNHFGFDKAGTEDTPDTVAEEVGEEIAEKASPDEGSETVDVPDHSSVEPGDVPALEDESADTGEKVQAFLEHQVGDGETLETTCGEIGDAVGEDGRAIVHALKSLEDWDAEKTGKSGPGEPSLWAVTRSEAGDDAVDAELVAVCTKCGESHDDGACWDDQDGNQSDADSDDQGGPESPPERKIDRGDDPDVQFWCGFCGQGPFVREDMVEGHHDRNGHPGDPVPRTEDPEHALEDYTDDAPIVDDERSADERVLDWVMDHVPGTQCWKTEDVAIECDITGNAAHDALEQVGEHLDDYAVEYDGQLWHIHAPVGGDV